MQCDGQVPCSLCVRTGDSCDYSRLDGRSQRSRHWQRGVEQTDDQPTGTLDAAGLDAPRQAGEAASSSANVASMHRRTPHMVPLRSKPSGSSSRLGKSQARGITDMQGKFEARPGVMIHDETGAGKATRPISTVFLTGDQRF